MTPFKSRLQVGLLAAVIASSVMAPTIGIQSAGADTYTVSADVARTGWDPNEAALAPSQVSSSDFGQQFSTAVDGPVNTQPLVIGTTAIVTTEKANAYGIDVTSGAIQWSRSFGAPFQSSSINCADIAPDLGQSSTPVYDPATGTVYLTTKIADGPTAQQPHWYLHAVSAVDGTERAGFPIVIQGTADNDPTVTFDPFLQQQRVGLLLVHGVVYAAFGSHCDHGAFRGWVMAVRVTGTPAIASSWVTEVANGGGGGIWQAGGGLMSDGDEPGGTPRIFFATGNGVSPPVGPGTSPPGYLAESVVRLGADATGHLTAKDFFSPANATTLDQNDTDLGAGGPAALPDSFGTPSHPHLIVEEGKDGRVFLLDRDHLGGRGQGPGGSDAALATLGPFNGVWGHPAVYPGEGGWVYYVENGGPLRAFARSVNANGDPTLTPAGASSELFGYTSGSPVVTSSGTSAGTALVWVVYSQNGTGSGAQLRAYDAVPSGGKMNLRWSTPIGNAAKFTTVATSGGRAILGTRDGNVLGYGRPAAIALNAQPVQFGLVGVGTTANSSAHFVATTTVTVSGATAPAPFAASSSGLPRTLHAGDTLDVPVSFSPTTPGSVSAALTLTTSLGSILSDLHGTGTRPGLTASPSPVDFGNLVTGFTKTLAVNVTNTGTASETIQSVTAPASPFTASGLPAAGTVIAAQQSLAIPVTYAPTAQGTDSGALTMVSNSGTMTAPLTGSAVTGQGHLQLTPTSTDFGSVVVGTSRTLSFDIANTGNIPITITLAKAPSGVFSAATPLSEGVTIGPDDSIQQQVTFTPSATGPATGGYTLNANDGQGVQTEQLSGTGVTGSALVPPTGNGWTRNGSATVTSAGDLQITPATAGQTGSAFANATVPSDGLDAHFTAQLSGGTGADGLTFTLLDAAQPASSMGAGGGALGFGGLTNAVAVTLDTYQNTNDPSANFVGVADGTVSALDDLHYLGTSTNISNLTSGSHDVDVNIYGGHLRVTIDGDLKIDVVVTLPSLVRPGFTAATGGLTNVHLVHNAVITTPSTVTDTTPPVVAFASPAAGTVSGRVTLTATASDDSSGVNRVEYFVDGSLLAAPTTSPYSASWDTTVVPEGTHQLRAVAYDGAGNASVPATRAVTVSNPPPIDASVSVDGRSALTATITTKSAGDLLLAFVSSDGPNANRQSSTVSGARLTWTLVSRANTTAGTAEIWQARASRILSGASIKMKLAKAGYDSSMTVVALTGVGHVGASAAGSATTGAPSVGLQTTAPGSWIFGVGVDAGHAIARTLASGQTLRHQWVDTVVANTFWVQSSDPSVPTGATARIADTAPTSDRWNLAAVEVTR